MTSAAETGSADQHLGDSLAALIDGELCHDSRDRVLAHLATCPGCKAEADAQRRLKSVFAHSPLPAPSDGLLARLQGLPEANDAPLPPPGGPRGPGAAGGTALPPRSTARGSAKGPPSPGSRFSAVPAVASAIGLRAEPLPGAAGGGRGFRIHEPGAARAHRGHRLAFAAAGAVSLAAFALGGAVGTAGSAASPVAQPGAAAASGPPALGVALSAAGRQNDSLPGLARSPQPVSPALAQLLAASSSPGRLGLLPASVSPGPSPAAPSAPAASASPAPPPAPPPSAAPSDARPQPSPSASPAPSAMEAVSPR